MNRSLNVVKTTIVGGVLFLVPFAVVLLVLGKILKIATKIVMPLAELLPFHSLIGLKTPVGLGALLLLGICFAAGLLARTEASRKAVNWLETAVLSNLPGYSLMKGVGEELAGNDPSDRNESILVRLDDGYVLGFLIERMDNGHTVVFLPGAPKPWDGDVMIIEDRRITVLTQSSKAAVTCLRRLGSGAGQLVGDRLKGAES
jgi:uncharacterized membrane protein